MGDLLQWALIAFVISILAGVLGFSGVSTGAARIGKVLFGVFLAVAVVLFLLVALGISIIF